MQLEQLKQLQTTLLINWFAAPVLGIWIWFKIGFFSAVVFVTIWLVADKLWDWLTGILIKAAWSGGSSENELLELNDGGEVPIPAASMMIIDLLGTLALPWAIAGYFLDWFS